MPVGLEWCLCESLDSNALTLSKRSIEFSSGYKDWGQVAGYFDGDGSILLKPKKHTISFTIEWTDTSLAHLEQLRTFLVERAVYTEPTIVESRGKYASFSLRVSFQASVLTLGRALLKYTFKKHYELLAMIGYLENRLSGDDLIARFNKAVEVGTRAGKIYKLSLPCTRIEGLRVARKLAARKAGLSNRLLTFRQVEEIRRRHIDLRAPIRDLARISGVSVSTIERAIYGR